MSLSFVLLVHTRVVVDPCVQSSLDSFCLDADISRSSGLLLPNGELVLADSIEIVWFSAVGVMALQRISEKLVHSELILVSSTVLSVFKNIDCHIDPFSNCGHSIFVRHWKTDALIRSREVVATFFLVVASVNSSSALVNVDTDAIGAPLISA
jgi:hypothetical protein